MVNKMEMQKVKNEEVLKEIEQEYDVETFYFDKNEESIYLSIDGDKDVKYHFSTINAIDFIPFLDGGFWRDECTKRWYGRYDNKRYLFHFTAEILNNLELNYGVSLLTLKSESQSGHRLKNLNNQLIDVQDAILSRIN